MSKRDKRALGVLVFLVAMVVVGYVWFSKTVMLPAHLSAILDNKTITIYQNGQEQRVHLGEFIGLYDPEKRELITGGNTEDAMLNAFPSRKVLEAMPPKYKVRVYDKATFVVDTMTESVEPVDDTAKKIMAAEGSFFSTSTGPQDGSRPDGPPNRTADNRESARVPYSFSIPKLDLLVRPQPDSSVELTYDITFKCETGGAPIDIVDIALPHGGYNLSDVKASLDGQKITDVRKSEVLSIGVAAHLSQPIPPGNEGKLELSCIVPDLVYRDLTDKDHASLRITPTWFDGHCLVGKTDLWILVNLPLGIKPEEVRYQFNRPFTRKGTTKKSSFVAWEMPDARLDGEHLVGLTFPKRWMQRVMPGTPQA